MAKMRKKKVVLVRSNLMYQDIRLPKAIRALNQEGYMIRLLSWDREGKTDDLEKPGDYEEIRLKLRTPRGIKVLAFLPIWWCFVFIHLLASRWDVVHAVNFDCVIPSAIASILKRKPIIYEILDIYEAEIVVPKAVGTTLMNLDKLFMRLADAVIVADEAQIEGIGGIPNLKVTPIYDSPPSDYGKADTGYQRNEVFRLFYAGLLYKIKRLNMDKVFQAIKDIEGVKLIIAGYGDLVEEIKEWVSLMPEKVEFLGEISYQDVIRKGSEADLFFILRDPVIPANRYTCGSSLFNAMICGKPVLANSGSSTAIKVSEENCGLVIDGNDVDQIGEAITKLKADRELCEQLGANARKAYEQKYDWQIMEQRLIALYRGIVEPKLAE